MNWMRDQKLWIHKLMVSASCQSAPVRRARSQHYLLSTPLPLRETLEHVRFFQMRLEQEGWTCCEASGWLLMDRLPKDEELERYRRSDEQTDSVEGAALLSLLNRHLVMGGQNTDLFRRAIYKAADEHPAVLEQLYEQLHGRFAEMLRRGEALPDIRKDLACLL